MKEVIGNEMYPMTRITLMATVFDCVEIQYSTTFCNIKDI